MKLITRMFAALLLTGLAGAAAAQDTPDALLGSWEGALVQGRNNMNLALTFAKQEGKYSAALTSEGMGIYGMPAPYVEVKGLNITVRIPRLDAEFTGTIRLDDAGTGITRIDGDWFQFSELVPVVLHSVEEPGF